jgi:hypothetical protein
MGPCIHGEQEQSFWGCSEVMAVQGGAPVLPSFKDNDVIGGTAQKQGVR